MRKSTFWIKCQAEEQVWPALDVNLASTSQQSDPSKTVRVKFVQVLLQVPQKNAKTVSISRDSKIEKLEKALTIWIEDQSQRKVALSGQIIREKALRLYEQLSQPDSLEENNERTFLASKGWLENFKKRVALHNVKTTGESASADHSAAKDFPAELKKIIEEKGYAPEQVFNADETGLFWKRLP
jgi:hypothetical protein